MKMIPQMCDLSSDGFRCTYPWGGCVNSTDDEVNEDGTTKHPPAGCRRWARIAGGGS